MVSAPPARHGEFAALGLASALAGVLREFRSGRVMVVQGSLKRYVWFEAGKVRSVSSTLEAERVGSWLIARRLVDAKVVGDLLLRKSREERLGDLLIKKGQITRDRLLDELRGLSIAVAARMLLEGGEYEYESGWSLPTDARVLDHEPVPLFVLAARRGTETAKLDALLGGGTRWMLAPGSGTASRTLELTGVERFLSARLEAPRSLEELRTELAHQPQDVSRALAALVVAGIVVPVSPVPRALLAPSQATAGGGDVAAAASTSERDSSNVPAANPELRRRLEQLEPGATAQPAGRARPESAAGPSPEELDRAARDKKTAAELLRAGDDPRIAYRMLASAVAIAPDAESLVVLAEIEMANPLWRQLALDHLKQAIGMEPKLTAAWLGLGNYWSLRGEPAKQQRCLEKILSYDARNEEVRHALDLLRGRKA